MRNLLLAALLMGAGPGMCAPITYVLDYGPQHIDRPEYLEAVASGPPTLLHLGKDVPFTHQWGPIQALGGENQAFGKGEHIRRLSPDETRERIRSLTTMIEGLHRAGVAMVMPYICAMTLSGHHERRTGFWEFYDHWDDYAALGIGPKPPADPITWMQRRPDGTLHHFYTYEGDFYPPYETNHRYAACVNNPHWRAWLLKVTEFAARCGCDGVFVDNAGSQRCYCETCRRLFPEFLRKRYRSEEIRALFGENPTLETKTEGLLWVETQRFWKESLHAHLAAIREAGERVRGRGKFFVFPNGGEHRPEDLGSTYRDADFLMFERSIGEYGTHPGTVRVPVTPDIAVREVNDNIFAYKITRAQGGRTQPIVLTRAGYPRRLPWAEMTPDSAILGMAECAAFAGGGGFLVPPKWADFAPALKQCRAFFEGRRDVYEGVEPWAPVGIAALGEQKLYGNNAHIEGVRQVTRALLEAHVLFDYVPEGRLTVKGLAGYRTLILPGVEVMDPEAARAVREYVRAGGSALVIGQAPSKDLRLQPLAETLPAPASAEVEAKKEGGGTWVLAPRMRPGRYVARWLAMASAEDLALAPGASPARFNAFRGPGRLLLHAVNYGVPLGLPAAPAGPAPEMRLRVPLPAGTRAVSVRAFDPEQPQAAEVEGVMRDGRCELTLSGLRVYRVLEIRLEE